MFGKSKKILALAALLTAGFIPCSFAAPPRRRVGPKSIAAPPSVGPKSIAAPPGDGLKETVEVYTLNTNGLGQYISGQRAIIVHLYKGSYKNKDIKTFKKEIGSMAKDKGLSAIFKSSKKNKLICTFSRN